MAGGQRHLLHFYNRAAFGISPKSLPDALEISIEQHIKQLISVPAEPLQIVDEDAATKLAQQARGSSMQRSEIREKIREELKKSQRQIRQVNLAWMQRMMVAEYAAIEKLVLFWHDHFGVRVVNTFKAQAHNNTLRKYALGPFKDLLLAVAKDPAMLQFLNNQQNTKVKPNENFAREVLELFTIGRGNYSESDIKNAARAFTGWGFDRLTGNFRFRLRQHDQGQKEFFGKKGNWDGEDIINIILEDKRTARFLAAKFFQYYVSETPDEEIISELADHYYDNGYHTSKLLEHMFTSDWFYEDRFINAKIKSPIELLVGFHNHLGLSFGIPSGWLFLQRNFSHVLFQPPSVNGWPNGREWIDSSSLVGRMQLPAVFAGIQKFERQEAEETDANDAFKVRGDRVIRSARLDLSQIKKIYQITNEKESLDIIAEFLLNAELPMDKKGPIMAELNRQTDSEKVQWLVLTLASLPEYQLN